MASRDQTSDFGWWARFEDDEYGFYGWLTSSMRAGEPWRYTEDPDNAYRFGTLKEARGAIAQFDPLPGGSWSVVEFKDQP